MTEEVVLALRMRDGAVPLVTQVRGTLIATSLRIVGERGQLEDYLARLPTPYHEAVRNAVPGVWLPIETAMAHCAAIDALGLSALDAIGRDIAVRIRGSFLGTMVRLASNVGVTPWIGLSGFERLWDRLLQGGSAAVYKVGPRWRGSNATASRWRGSPTSATPGAG